MAGILVDINDKGAIHKETLEIISSVTKPNNEASAHEALSLGTKTVMKFRAVIEVITNRGTNRPFSDRLTTRPQGCQQWSIIGNTPGTK